MEKGESNLRKRSIGPESPVNCKYRSVVVVAVGVVVVVVVLEVIVAIVHLL